MLRKVLHSIVDSLFQLGSTEMNSAKELAQRTANKFDSHSKSIQDFADMLINSLKRVVILPGNMKWYATSREQMWKSFHKKQTTELPLL